MVKTKKQICKNSNKSKKYKPLNLSVSKFRNQDKDYEELENKFINFLKNNPSKEQMNKLYDTTIYFAASDSIGEGWNYVDDFTRQEFDIACKLIKYNISSLIFKELQRQTDIIKQKIETPPAELPPFFSPLDFCTLAPLDVLKLGCLSHLVLGSLFEALRFITPSAKMLSSPK